GRITKIEKLGTNNEEVTQVSYDYLEEKRTFTIKYGDWLIESKDFPLENKLGDGFSTFEDVPLSNYMGEVQSNERSVFTGESSSISWEMEFDPLDYIPAPLIYDHNLEPTTSWKPEVTSRANGDIYRSVTEQYPFTEYGLLFSGGKWIDKEYSYYPSIETREEIKKQLDENTDQFTSIYGDQFNYKNFSGRYFFTVGTLRNLPSDHSLREQIKDIAWKHASNLISGETIEISEEEKGLFSRVFFELKVHSPTFEDVNGIVINNHEDYIKAVKIHDNAPLEIIQKVFKKYESL
ncbi:hypothetical protein, partial [Xanthovirga aplysinae]|uniref:hypothetical protein n=1 Tax=Xanthovirga aplysinae TaxID=2529853 RepID=UPI001656C4A0